MDTSRDHEISNMYVCAHTLRLTTKAMDYFLDKHSDLIESIEENGEYDLTTIKTIDFDSVVETEQEKDYIDLELLNRSIVSRGEYGSSIVDLCFRIMERDKRNLRKAGCPQRYHNYSGIVEDKDW